MVLSHELGQVWMVNDFSGYIRADSLDKDHPLNTPYRFWYQNGDNLDKICLNYARNTK